MDPRVSGYLNAALLKVLGEPIPASDMDYADASRAFGLLHGDGSDAAGMSSDGRVDPLMRRCHRSDEAGNASIIGRRRTFLSRHAEAPYG